jgi:hypothetical protein
MTNTPKSPNRRRQRIVVITIAVVVLGLGWWYWPRVGVDRQFVGDWVLKTGYQHDYKAIRILADGTFETYALPNDLLSGVRDQKLSCYSDEGHFSIRAPRAAPSNLWDLWRLAQSLARRERNPFDTHYWITRIDSTSFLIHNNDTVLPFRRGAVAK